MLSCQLLLSFLHSAQAIRQLKRPDLHCALCNRWDYYKFCCDTLVNFVILSDTIKKDPSMKEKALKKHKCLVRRYRNDRKRGSFNSKRKLEKSHSRTKFE